MAAHHCFSMKIKSRSFHEKYTVLFHAVPEFPFALQQTTWTSLNAITHYKTGQKNKRHPGISCNIQASMNILDLHGRSMSVQYFPRAHNERTQWIYMEHERAPKSTATNSCQCLAQTGAV